MAEILTESFCERCGTRYTFESPRQRVRLKGVKVLSRGLKNFVLSDDTSMDEAMAAARSETDRAVTSYQLDAFHKTFNFCMSCRQYTCPNCWNEVEARCLSCAPHLGHEILPAPFPNLDATVGLALATEPIGLITEDGSNGHTHAAEAAELEAAKVEAAELEAAKVDGFSEAATLAGVGDSDAGEPVEPLDQIDAAARLEALTAAADLDVTDTIEVDGIAPAEPEATVEAPGMAPDAIEAAPVEPIAAEVVVDPGPEAPALPTDIRGKTAGQTARLLRWFRPGQSLDAELDEYERDRTAALTGAAAAAVTTDDDTVQAPVAETPSPESLPVAETASPEPTSAADTAATSTQPQPGHEPAPAAPAQPPPDVAPPSGDSVAQPTWQRVAPDPTPQIPVPPPVGPPASQPASASARGTTEAQWPVKPEWPTVAAPSAGLPFLGRPAAPQGGLDAIWAESAREVVTPPTPGKAVGGVQSCVSCGLSLSATARFCRRCGTPQAR